MKHARLFSALLLLFALCLPSALAQGSAPGDFDGPVSLPTALFQDGCPDRGVKLLAASEIASGLGVSCGKGIAFSFDGVHYQPSDDKCPRWLEYTPSRQVPDTQTVQEGLSYQFQNHVKVTKQEYACVGIGCGLLWLEGCCEAVGEEKVVNILDNWVPAVCGREEVITAPRILAAG